MQELTSRPVILVVGDDGTTGQLLHDHQGLTSIVLTATTVEKAFAALREHRVDVVLADIGRLETDGDDLVSRVLEADNELAVILVSTRETAWATAAGMRQGAMDYVIKPIDVDELVRAVNRALKRRALRREERKDERRLSDEVVDLVEDKRRAQKILEELITSALDALVIALEAKDPHMRGHSAQVSSLATSVAAHLGLPDEDIEHIRMAGRLHDIGNIGVREEVLNQKQALTRDQYDHVKRHVLIGVEILKPLVTLKPAVEFIRGHHEHWDGGGYLDGLRHEQIPMGAQILGGAEVFCAMARSRPYRQALDLDAAVNRSRTLSGTVLAPDVATALVTVVERHEVLTFLVD